MPRPLTTSPKVREAHRPREAHTHRAEKRVHANATRARRGHNATRLHPRLHANLTGHEVEPPRQHDRGTYLLAIGVMTGPLNFDRRAWIREHAPAPPELLVRFVLGRCMENRLDMLYLLDEEHRTYRDLHRFKNASDGFRSAHVLKTYEWYRYAMGLDAR